MSGQFHRLIPEGRVVVAITVDGEPVSSLAGESVLTAIMSARRHLRPFDFSETKRAGFCLMGACQDCWVHLDSGERVRACSTPVAPSMNIVTNAGRRSDGE